jgi:hypothetical protein
MASRFRKERPTMNAPFDTLAFVSAIKETVLGETGAVKLARAIADVAMPQLATKHDLETAVSQLERAMLRQTITLGAMVAGVGGVLLGLAKVLFA